MQLNASVYSSNLDIMELLLSCISEVVSKSFLKKYVWIIEIIVVDGVVCPLL